MFDKETTRLIENVSLKRSLFFESFQKSRNDYLRYTQRIKSVEESSTRGIELHLLTLSSFCYLIRVILLWAEIFSLLMKFRLLFETERRYSEAEKEPSAPRCTIIETTSIVKNKAVRSKKCLVRNLIYSWKRITRV